MLLIVLFDVRDGVLHDDVALRQSLLEPLQCRFAEFHICEHNAFQLRKLLEVLEGFIREVEALQIERAQLLKVNEMRHAAIRQRRVLFDPHAVQPAEAAQVWQAVVRDLRPAQIEALQSRQTADDLQHFVRSLGVVQVQMFEIRKRQQLLKLFHRDACTVRIHPLGRVVVCFVEDRYGHKTAVTAA